ncbi:sulfotransferase family protein [Iodidimonas gelatinilytica]|uniref:sulfotransferase family protein n=1 Tax=Iodidimonas gelatinilytica TaxID=1236966 RepID=UPI0012315BD8|nr:sulfotransferase [Iodidimonas gelatinilytica]
MIQNTGFPPRLFIIGAQKSATTFFAQAVGQHSSVVVSNPKEPDYYTVHRQAGLDWYKNKFTKAEDAVLLDASTSYSSAPINPDEQRQDNPRFGVPERIYKASPDARFIYIVRDPVARTYAGYWHSVRAGEETRPFLKAIAENSFYLDISRYHFQLQCYLQYFGMDRFLILSSSDVTANPQEAVHRAWSHAGLAVDRSASINSERRNVSYQYSPGMQRLMRLPGAKQGMKRMTHMARRLLPSSFIDGARGALTRSLPKMKDHEKEAVADYLREDTEAFSKLTGIIFST